MSDPGAAVPVYFEESWAIISSVGLVNVLFGFLIVGMTALSPITLVPIICSAAAAIANGLCYYAFYADYPVHSRVAAAVFADLLWLIQEAGLSFYSYLILIRILDRRNKRIFLCLFWALMSSIAIIRVAIATLRVDQILTSSLELQSVVSYLHTGYFTAIAAVEIVSSVFLLRVYAIGRAKAALRANLFKHLMRSTEMRLSALTFIGVTRAVTYSFQTTAQSATSVAGQVDRFVVVLEVMYPVVMMIDIVASRTIYINYRREGPPGDDEMNKGIPKFLTSAL